MLSTSSLAFLKRLLDTPAPSGFGGPAARVWREEAGTFADKVTSDVTGNSMAEVNPDGSPTILLDGHIDEIGVIVQYIDDDGYVYFSPIGGWDPQVLVGQRIRFLGRGGDVLGVVGRKPIHVIKTADREHAAKLSDLWIDIGASSRAEAEGRLSVGDPGVIDSKTVDFPNNRIVSRSIDDRIGGGPVISRGSIISPVVFDLLRTTAERHQIKYTVHAAGRETSTNADAIHIAREGVATALVSVPNRYMHSPNELVSLEDVDKTASLLAETCREVTTKLDFAAR